MFSNKQVHVLSFDACYVMDDMFMNVDFVLSRIAVSAIFLTSHSILGLSILFNTE